jgi:hypothetical protein
VQRRLKVAASQGLYDPAASLVLKKQSVLTNDAGQVTARWDKLGQEGQDDNPALHITPRTITKISTLYDADGKITQRWVSERPEEIEKISAWQAFADELKSSLPRYEAIPEPTHSTEDTLVCYPVGDHHLGMLSWKHETGESYDLEIGENLLVQATDYLMQCAPNSAQALIAFLGDFMHYDSFVPVTPTSGNHLDADSRFPKMVRASVRAMRYMIDSALKKHGKVHVIVEIGNHDLSSSIFLMECLRIAYENEPRITIDTSPMHFHYFKYGDVLIGTHHGHGTKMENLPIIMATDVAEWWGATKHRYIWTGHMHSAKRIQQQDHSGVDVEQFRVLPPSDAWAAQKGYRSIRDMKAIVMHRKYGEIARITFNPEMLRD